MTTSVSAGQQLFIGGEWRDASAGTFPDYNPSTGEIWAEIPNASRDDATAAVEAAAAAQPAWAALPHTERARVLLKAADSLEAGQMEYVTALCEEAGGWFGKGMFETGYAPGLLREAAAAAHQSVGEILPDPYGKLSMVVRVPFGVVTIISPWNFPLLLSMRAVAFALALGNAVVLKPSEETPVTGGLLIGRLFDEAGLPAGVLNVVTCSRDSVTEIGDELVTHPLVGAISFTGSTAVGKQIAAKAAPHLKKVSLELGGKDALIVLDDADLDRAVDAATFGSFMHQGQICMSVERVIVDASVADEFTKRFVAKAKTLGAGPTDNKGNIVGPVINERQRDKIHAQVEDAVANGAQLLAGGTYEGLVYQPTVLAGVTPAMRVFQEETFGPVATITVANGEDEAIELANDSEYGLSAGIITQDDERGLRIARRLKTGMAHVNDCSVYDEPNAPFGGMRNSGVGRHGGSASFEAFTTTRWLTLERGGRHYPF